jgi:hypothetical protein
VPGLVFCKGEVTCQADSSVIYATTINIILVYIQMFGIVTIYRRTCKSFAPKRLLQRLRHAGLPTERAETLLALLEITLSKPTVSHILRQAAFCCAAANSLTSMGKKALEAMEFCEYTPQSSIRE